VTIGDWGLEIVDWGLGIGDWGLKIGNWSVIGLDNVFISNTQIFLNSIDTQNKNSIEPKIWNFNESFFERIRDNLDVDEDKSFINSRGSFYKIIK